MTFCMALAFQWALHALDFSRADTKQAFWDQALDWGIIDKFREVTISCLATDEAQKITSCVSEVLGPTNPSAWRVAKNGTLPRSQQKLAEFDGQRQDHRKSSFQRIEAKRFVEDLHRFLQFFEVPQSGGKNRQNGNLRESQRVGMKEATWIKTVARPNASTSMRNWDPVLATTHGVGVQRVVLVQCWYK